MFSQKLSQYILQHREDESYSKLTEQLYIENSHLENNGVNIRQSKVNAIGEGLKKVSPIKPLSNIFGSRILLKVTNICFAHCRYCFRRDDIGEKEGRISKELLEEAYEKIANLNNIREVVISGGEPFVLPNQTMVSVIENLFKMPNVKRIRIDTSIFSHNPKRITGDLVDKMKGLKKKYDKQIIVIGHFTHYLELTQEVKDAADKFLYAGIPLRSHTPLLNRVNNSAETLIKLFSDLVDFGIHPYYLIHYIAHGRTKHFEVALSEGLNIYDKVLQNSTGIEIPHYILYLKDGKGKKRLLSSNIEILGDGEYRVRDKNGDEYIHKDFGR